MRKERIEYSSSVDALVAVAKRLSIYENRYGMTSEDFYDGYQKGQKEDSLDFVEWANDYQHYVAIRSEIEKTCAMLLDPLRDYLDEIEAVVRDLPGAYAERYEEEILAANRVNLVSEFVSGMGSYWNLMTRSLRQGRPSGIWTIATTFRISKAGSFSAMTIPHTFPS
jgi:hypothetical protein